MYVLKTLAVTIGVIGSIGIWFIAWRRIPKDQQLLYYVCAGVFGAITLYMYLAGPGW